MTILERIAVVESELINLKRLIWLVLGGTGFNIGMNFL